MNRQYYLLMCALLATTHLSDLQAKGFEPVQYGGAGLIERTKHSNNERDLAVQAFNKVLIYQNTTSSVAVLVDTSDGVFVLLNGEKGSGIIIDKAHDKGAYILKGLWHESFEDLNEFLSSLDSPVAKLLDRSECRLFNLHKVPKKILNEITEIVKDLVFCIDADLELDLTVALKLVLCIVDELLKLFKGPLRGLLDLIDDAAIYVLYDLGGLLKALQALGHVIKEVKGDLDSCKRDGIEIDVANVLGAANGLKALITLIGNVGDKIVGTDLVKELSNPETLFLLVAKLGGDIKFGLTGVFKAAGEQAAFFNKSQKDVEFVILAFIEYMYYSGKLVRCPLTQEFERGLKELLNALEESGLTKALCSLVDIIETMLDRKLVISGIDSSANIDLLLNGFLNYKGDLLTAIIEACLIISNVYPASRSFLQLLLVLISKLDALCGIEQLKGLGVDVVVDVKISDKHVLKRILAAVEDLASCFKGDLFEGLLKLPAIGVVIETFNEDVKKASNGTLSLKKVLKDSGEVGDLIKGIIQVVSDISIGASKAVCTKSKEVLKVVSSIWAYIRIDIDVYAVAIV